MKALILAAGRGERLLPMTESRPKALLPIANKPLIDYQIAALKREGVYEIAVVAGHYEEKLRAHLDDVKFYRDTRISGTASAVYAAREFIDEDFILIYGDVFFDGPLDALIREKNAMLIYHVSDVSAYGEVITTHEGFLHDIREKKGRGEGFINAGLYHLEPEIVDFIAQTSQSERGEYEITDALTAMSRELADRSDGSDSNGSDRNGRGIKTIIFEGYWRDIGYPWDYLDANMYMLRKIGFHIGENTDVWDTAIIRKPVIIGRDCEIKNCVIEHSVIGDECTVGEFSVVKRSVVMRRSRVPHLNYVADSIIGERCNLGAGTKIANLRFDGKNVKMLVKGEVVDSGRRKLGAVIGDDVKTGINVSIYPGVKISGGRWIDAETLVRRDL